MRFLSFFTAVAALPISLVAGCGSDNDSGPTVDRQSAALLVSEATSRAQIDIDSLRANAATGQASASFACSNGGMASAAGAVDIAAEPLTVNVDVDLDYADCMTDRNVVINGALDFSQLVVVGGNQLVYVDTILTGTARFSGAYEATCNIDLNVRLDSNTGAVVMVEGSACGYRADELDLSVRKNW